MQSVQAILTLSTVPVGNGPAGGPPAPEEDFLRMFAEGSREADVAGDRAADGLPVMMGVVLPLERAGEGLGKGETAASEPASAGGVPGAPWAPGQDAAVLFDLAPTIRAEGEPAASSVPVVATGPVVQGHVAEPLPSTFPDADLDETHAKPGRRGDRTELAGPDIARVADPAAPPTANTGSNLLGRVTEPERDLIAAPSLTTEPAGEIGAPMEPERKASVAATPAATAGETRPPQEEIGPLEAVASRERTLAARPDGAPKVTGDSAVAARFGRTAAGRAAPGVFDGPTGASSEAPPPQAPTDPVADGQASPLGPPDSPRQPPASQAVAPTWKQHAYAAGEVPVLRPAQGTTSAADPTAEKAEGPGPAPNPGATTDSTPRSLHPGVWEQSFTAAVDPATGAEHEPDHLGTAPLRPLLVPLPASATTEPVTWADGGAKADAGLPPGTSPNMDVFAPPRRTEAAAAAAAAVVEPTPLPMDAKPALLALAQPLPQDPDPDDAGLASLPGVASLGPAPQGATAAPLPAAAPNVHQLATQMSAQLAQSSDGSTELALSPEELGKVRLKLKPDIHHPDRMVVMISFERPETLELFRRHAGDLADALRAAGYSGTDIGFGQEGGSAPGSDRRALPGTGGRDGQLAGDLPAPPSPSPARMAAGASLDLRL